MRRSFHFVAALSLCVAALVSVFTSPATASASSGYLMLSSDGKVYPFGDAPFCGHSDVVFSSKASDVEITPNGKGYWVLVDSGYVEFMDCGMPTQDYLDYETSNSINLARGEKAVSLSALPDGTGYWVFTDRGKAVPFGNAQFYGDMSSVALNGPVLGSVATPTGRGYWMVGSDGGIFSFGDAKFFGSTGNLKLNKPVMSMAPDPDGVGYWLVASDGGIFAFDAPFYGSMGATPLNKPISGMVTGPGGYMMVAQDGGIFSFGDVAFHGSLGATPPPAPVVAVALMPSEPTLAGAGTPPPPSTTTTTTTAPPPPPAEGTFPGDGTFVVGIDLQPGTYRTTGSTDGCYWARLSGFGGSFDEIKANDIGDGPRVVTIDASDEGFETSRCGTWTKHLVQMTQNKTNFGEGVFITGLDFTPGTYRTVSSTDSCYWARLSGFGGSFDEIIANDIGDGIRTVTIKSTDAGIRTSRCGNWTRIG